MKGLIIKDILNLRNYMKQLVLVFIFFMAYGIFFKNGTVVGSMINMMLSMQIITTISYDEYTKWDKYALTMDLNRKDIVLSKYVFFILCVIAGIIIGNIASLIINNIINKPFDINEEYAISIIVPGIFVILFSIVIPIVFKTSVEKARVIMIAVFFIPFILLSLFAKIVKNGTISILTIANLDMIFKFGLIGLIILDLVVLIISYKVSLSIYNKKEF